MAERAERSRQELVDEITGPLARQHSTATVLFHHAIAERLGLGPTDHKCLDLLHERGAMTASDLAVVTGLTSGAISGVVSRLERAGYVRREPDPYDQRKQILTPAYGRLDALHEVFGSLRQEAAALVEGFDVDQLAVIAEFLRRATDFSYRQTALLRAQSLSGTRTRVPQRPDNPTRSDE